MYNGLIGNEPSYKGLRLVYLLTTNLQLVNFSLAHKPYQKLCFNMYVNDKLTLFPKNIGKVTHYNIVVRCLPVWVGMLQTRLAHLVLLLVLAIKVVSSALSKHIFCVISCMKMKLLCLWAVFMIFDAAMLYCKKTFKF